MALPTDIPLNPDSGSQQPLVVVPKTDSNDVNDKKKVVQSGRDDHKKLQVKRELKSIIEDHTKHIRRSLERIQKELPTMTNDDDRSLGVIEQELYLMNQYHENLNVLSGMGFSHLESMKRKK